MGNPFVTAEYGQVSHSSRRTARYTKAQARAAQQITARNAEAGGALPAYYRTQTHFIVAEGDVASDCGGLLIREFLVAHGGHFLSW